MKKNLKIFFWKKKKFEKKNLKKNFWKNKFEKNKFLKKNCFISPPDGRSAQLNPAPYTKFLSLSKLTHKIELTIQNIKIFNNFQSPYFSERDKGPPMEIQERAWSPLWISKGLKFLQMKDLDFNTPMVTKWPSFGAKTFTNTIFVFQTICTKSQFMVIYGNLW